jgi:hypothetical protein
MQLRPLMSLKGHREFSWRLSGITLHGPAPARLSETEVGVDDAMGRLARVNGTRNPLIMANSR